MTERVALTNILLILPYRWQNGLLLRIFNDSLVQMTERVAPKNILLILSCRWQKGLLLIKNILLIFPCRWQNGLLLRIFYWFSRADDRTGCSYEYSIDSPVQMTERAAPKNIQLILSCRWQNGLLLIKNILLILPCRWQNGFPLRIFNWFSRADGRTGCS